MEITEKSFWEKYWGEIKLPQKVDFNFKNDKVISETIIEHIPKAKPGESALEIGCAPGKWMLLIHEYLNYKIHGFEYVDAAAEKTKENFLICNIPKEEFKVITADFLSQEPTPKYNLVTSFGFIEHFEDYKDIYFKHLGYSKKDGYIVIGFPSFRGVNYYLQLCIDKISGSKIIDNHNISMMNKELMERMVVDSGKELVYIDYIGGFEPALFNLNDIRNGVLRFVFKAYSKTLSLLFPHTKNKYISSYIIFIVKNA